MIKGNSLLSSLALGIGLTLGISTSAIAYPKNYNLRSSEVRVVYPSRYSHRNSRYYRNPSPYTSRYNRNYNRNSYRRGRDYYGGYNNNCRNGRRRRRPNLTIINPPVYRNNLSLPNYIKIRTVR